MTVTESSAECGKLMLIMDTGEFLSIIESVLQNPTNFAAAPRTVDLR
jgi:hypothetical protein